MRGSVLAARFAISIHWIVCSVNAYSGSITKNVVIPGLKNGMDYTKLGSSDLEVSKVCMGTMTFGEQNTVEEGVEQLHLAYDQYGINFLDTAEIYPVPTKAETQGLTDESVKRFLASSSQKREDIVLATKVAGYSEQMTWLPREKGTDVIRLSEKQILYSVDKSLERLGTDYIDLLQLHWPDRYIGGMFGSPDFTPKMLREDSIAFEETLGALQKVIDAGKVRYIGVSNESPYGVCSMAELAKQQSSLYPKIVSIQNSYSMVVRKDFEAGLTEACYHHKVGLLPYSPLAGGTLTGKYRGDRESIDPKARLNLFPGFMDRYLGSTNEAAVNAYGDLAKELDLTPTEMALSWCYHREHVASTIIGATTIPQLKENIESYDIKLDDEAMKKINAIYKEYTDPTKNP